MNIYNDLIHNVYLIIYVVPDPSEGFRKHNLVRDTGLHYLTELMQCIYYVQQNRHRCAIYRQVYKIVCRSCAIYQQETFSDHADAILRLP